MVEAQSKKKRTLDQYEVNYGKQFRPAVYLHKLLLSDYGPTKVWCLVAKQ